MGEIRKMRKEEKGRRREGGGQEGGRMPYLLHTLSLPSGGRSLQSVELVHEQLTKNFDVSVLKATYLILVCVCVCVCVCVWGGGGGGGGGG